MRPEIIGFSILGSTAAALIAAGFYAVFARPSGAKAELYRQEIINGFLRVGGLVLAFTIFFLLCFSANYVSRGWKPLTFVVGAASFVLLCVMNSRWERYCEDRITGYGAEPGPSRWVLAFLVAAIVGFGLLVTPRTPRDILLVSVAPAVVFCSYAGMFRETRSWQKIPNIPVATYFFYCCGVLWYLRVPNSEVIALTCLAIGLFLVFRGIQQWQDANSSRATTKSTRLSK